MNLYSLNHKLSRREFIKISLAMTALAACSPIPSKSFSTPFPGAAALAAARMTTTYSPQTWLAASRLTFGPVQADLDWIEKNGVDAFIEEQLGYEQIDDSALQPRLAGFKSLNQSVTEIINDSRRDVLLDLQQAALLRAVYSRRQLAELMVDFWTNHFNIFFNKGQDHYLKTVDDREVIRKYPLASFRQLLGATAHSPAMLLNLDNNTNRKDHPNENYARELMELHTIGVNGGYTQQDVADVARAFTGWTIYGVNSPASLVGTFQFTPGQHDQQPKTILGHSLAANGGMQDGEQVLDLLANHPSCVHFICTKLARRFIADNPPESAVQAGVSAFQKSNGDLKATLGAILHSPEFKNSTTQKIKRPLEFVASSLRALQAEISDSKQVNTLLGIMGQPLFLWPAPNGFPDVSPAWINSGVLLARWNYSLALASGNLKGVYIDLKSFTLQNNDLPTAWSQYLLVSTLPPDALNALKPFASPDMLPELVALLLSSPIYQLRG
jgi:uncharacterized protein (DUF1800 family)